MQYLVNVIQVLEGRKTYLVATAGALLNIYLLLDPTAFSPSVILKINAVLVFLGGAALRAGINKV